MPPAKTLVPLILFTIVILCLNACYVGRFFTLNIADINDYQHFPSLPIQKGDSTFLFSQATPKKITSTIKIKEKNYHFEKGLEKSGTKAFIIIRNDSILYEKFFDNYTKNTLHSSFSISKSFVSALIGIAIDEGKIKSVKEPITNYLDFLKDEKFKKITIEHLLDMHSGIKFSEQYFTPFSSIAKYYYTKNLKKALPQLKVASSPGGDFNYQSINTLLLTQILEVATKEKANYYLQEKIWKRIGMENQGTWSIDSKKNQTIKAFSHLQLTPYDYARFGRLYLNQGNWDNEQVISKQWVTQSTTFDTLKNKLIYSYQWWHNRTFEFVEKAKPTDKINFRYTIKNNLGDEHEIRVTDKNDYYAEGILGQFIYINPDKKIIIVRLGKKYRANNWPLVFESISRQL
ncbi:MAG: beta-lactamase family protein [Flavobacteriales bacterium]|jgi:CubicO group peptidase (beta-lactamase class C family)|nr:beta-lactamase family protein [Flavobacteriales bacterium]